ncbi:carboxymuconolactone decarboxylase family protein [Pedobacter sp. UBA5917]|uniref:carboxymuconolactone decarboxylase family protein n=1 Tax=Pedobacter sp. UBA5917 TaxID=1947061 RepID=UPI0025DCD253|nr:carboxymuconolactone decarboxylase family protein [Pedobacter sp. UBA5917]
MKRLMIALTMVFGLSADINAGEPKATQTLTIKQQKLVIISSLTAKGNLDDLKITLNSALTSGLTVNEIKETIVHLYAYCGFPRSIRGLQTFMAVLEERKAKGINDKQGAVATPVKDKRSKYERGKETLAKLTGAPQNGARTGYAAFAPEIEVFLKEHLFADIFERDILTYAERELVTIAVLSSIGGVEPMLKSHLGICLNVGLSAGQLQQFVELIRSVAGGKEADAAAIILNEVLKDKK